MNSMMMGTALIAAAGALGLSGCDSRESAPTTPATQTTQDRGGTTTPADNTRNNRGDAGRDAKTPMNQSQSSEHIGLTADIRRAIISDETLSAEAKNCKIITDDSGRVWLRGTVKSQGEKDLVGRIAGRIAGEDIVTNELEISDG